MAKVGGLDCDEYSLDFGIATARRAASLAAGRLTGPPPSGDDDGASFTPAYGAPEQWSPKSWGPTGPWTDVWGLALTLVEALAGKPAIDGDSYEMRRICLDEKRRPTPRALGTDVSREIDRVFERALALDPRRRWKDVESFWSEIERAMGLVPVLGMRDARRDSGTFPQRFPPAPGLGADDSSSPPQPPPEAVDVFAERPGNALDPDDRELDSAPPAQAGSNSMKATGHMWTPMTKPSPPSSSGSGQSMRPRLGPDRRDRSVTLQRTTRCRTRRSFSHPWQPFVEHGGGNTNGRAETSTSGELEFDLTKASSPANPVAASAAASAASREHNVAAIEVDFHLAVQPWAGGLPAPMRRQRGQARGPSMVQRCMPAARRPRV